MKKSAQTVIREGTCYTIAAANGRVLEVADFNTENGASIRLWSYEGQPWQQWIFEEAAEGQYRIKNRQGDGPGHEWGCERNLGAPVGENHRQGPAVGDCSRRWRQGQDPQCAG